MPVASRLPRSTIDNSLGFVIRGLRADVNTQPNVWGAGAFRGRGTAGVLIG